MNLAGERIVPYMNDTNGWRAVGAGAADWKLEPGDHAQRRLRVPAQDRARRQRLSAARRHNAARHQPHLPLHHARRSALGSARHLRHLQHRRAPRSHVFADVARLRRRQPQPLAHPGQRDLRLRLLLRGRVQHRLGARSDSSLRPTEPTTSTTIATPASCASMPKPKRWSRATSTPAPITQDITAGGELFLRSVQQPGFYTVAESLSIRAASCRTARSTPTSARKISTSRSRRFRRPAIRIRLSLRLESAGPRRLWEDSHQSSGVIQDRIHLPGRIQLIAGGALRFAARPQLLRVRELQRPTDPRP